MVANGTPAPPNKRTNLAPPLSPEGPIRAGPRPPPSPRRPEAGGGSGSPTKIRGSKQLGTVDEVSTSDDMSTQRSMRDLPPRRIGSGTSMEENGKLLGHLRGTETDSQTHLRRNHPLLHLRPSLGRACLARSHPRSLFGSNLSGPKG
jgi:hypothetical protein